MPEFSGWMYTDARRFMDCSKCGAKAGDPCVTPKGRKTNGGIPHMERTEALVQKFGKERWTRPIGAGVPNIFQIKP